MHLTPSEGTCLLEGLDEGHAAAEPEAVDAERNRRHLRELASPFRTVWG